MPKDAVQFNRHLSTKVRSQENFAFLWSLCLTFILILASGISFSESSIHISVFAGLLVVLSVWYFARNQTNALNRLHPFVLILKYPAILFSLSGIFSALQTTPETQLSVDYTALATQDFANHLWVFSLIYGCMLLNEFLDDSRIFRTSEVAGILVKDMIRYSLFLSAFIWIIIEQLT